MFLSTPAWWRTLIGASYQAGAKFRYIDPLRSWFFALDVSALCTGLLLVFCMWWHGRALRSPVKTWYLRVLGIASPWGMFGRSFLVGVFSIFFHQTPIEDVNQWEIAAALGFVQPVPLPLAPGTIDIRGKNC
jgi:hypothetical protein